MTRTQLRAACPSVAVPMPRFRKREAAAVLTLTEAVLRVLSRAKTSASPFAVFVVDGQLMLSNVQTMNFTDLARRYPDQMVGTYQRGVTVSALVEDLGEWLGEAV